MSNETRKCNYRVFCAVLLLTGCGCGLSPQAKEAGFLKRGQAKVAKKDYARAILEFRTAAQANPKDAEPYYQLGLAYLESRDWAAAVKAFRQSTQLNPKHAGATLKLAELMVASRNKEQIERASVKLEDLLAAAPNSLESLDALAIAELELGKPEDAMKRLEVALQRFPAHLESAVGLARLKLRQKDFAGAEAVLKKAVAAAPQSAPAALVLGQFYLIQRQPEKAEAEIRNALQLEPKNAGALLALGSIQMAAKRMDEADQTYQRLASLPEKTYKPIHALFLYRTGRKDAAQAELENLARQYPYDSVVRSPLVSIYLQMNKSWEVQDLLAFALKRNPRDTDALLQRSVLYLKLGKLTEANQDLGQVLHFHPDSAEAHFAMAGILRAEGMWGRENDELNTALRLNPRLLGARLVLARNFLLANQSKSALDLLDQAPAPQKNIAALVIERNWALLVAGEIKEVERLLDLYLRAHRIPELVFQEAILKMSQRDYTGARSAAEEVLQANPEDVRAARVIVSAYRAQNDPRKALDRLTEIVAHRPKSAPLQNLLGEWYLTAGRLDEARTAFAGAKSADPEFHAADLYLAEIDRQQNRTDAARQRLTGVVAADAKNVPALMQLAALEEATGDRAKAIARYRSVLAADSSNVPALNSLAYDLTGDSPDEALKFAQQAGDLAPDNASVQDTLGRVYYKKGIYRTAVNYLKTAVTKEPTPRRQFHLAMSYLKAGQQELGLQMLHTALASDPSLAKTETGW